MRAERSIQKEDKGHRLAWSDGADGTTSTDAHAIAAAGSSVGGALPPPARAHPPPPTVPQRPPVCRRVGTHGDVHADAGYGMDRHARARRKNIFSRRPAAIRSFPTAGYYSVYLSYGIF